MLGIGESGKSWQTTLFGIATMLCGAGVIVGGFLVPAAAAIAIPAGIGMITGGMIGIKSKDSGVTGVPNAMDPKLEATTPPKNNIPVVTGK